MKDDDPIRLSSSADDAALREMLDAGTKELPTDAQLAAVAAKLGPILGGPGGGPGGGSARWAAVAKAAAVAGVAATAVWGLTQASSPPPPGVPPAAPVATVAPVVVPSAEPPVSAPRPSAAVPTPTTERSASPPPKPHDTEDEVQLLERAQDALDKEPAAALALADKDMRLFPAGLLRQEAEVIAIDALTRLGRRTEAESRAATFRGRYPSSTHVRRIDAILGQD
jgi:hypothetical protein